MGFIPLNNEPSKGFTPVGNKGFTPVGVDTPEQRFARTQAGVARRTGAPADVEAEVSGVELPLVDPVSAGVGGFTGAFVPAVRGGATLLTAAGRGLASAAAAEITEPIIGTAAEELGAKFPGLELPFAVITGLLSGATIERKIEKALTKWLGRKAAKTDITKVITAINSGKKSAFLSKISEDLTDDIKKSPALAKKATTKLVEEANTARGADRRVFRRDRSGEDRDFDIVRNMVDRRKAGRAVGDFKETVAEVRDIRTPRGQAPPGSQAPDVPRGTIPTVEATPPLAGGLAHGVKLPKMAVNINLERVGLNYSPKKLVLDMTDQYRDAIIKAKRGKVPLAETRKKADELIKMIGDDRTTEEFISDISKKTRDLDAHVTAGRDIMATAAERLDILRKAAVESGSDEALARFKLAMNDTAGIIAEVGATGSEVGRALSAQRLVSKPSRNWKAIIRALGGRDINEEMAKRLSQIDPLDQRSVNKFIRQAATATRKDMIFEAWVNALLSSPKTHIVNTLSNTLTFLSKLPEEATAASIDMLRAGITRTPRERFFGELPQHAFGAYAGLKEGVRKGITAFVDELPSEGISKLEIRPDRFQAIPSKTFRKGVAKTRIFGKEIPFTGELELGGKQVRLPGRLLIAEDEFFKAINYQSELYSTVYRRAVQEGKRGTARTQRMAELLADPPEDLVANAKGEMLYRVFQKDLGKTGRDFQRFREDAFGGMFKYIVPFLRTPVNIAKFGLERTPLNYPRIFRKMMKGELKGGEVSDELAKATLGSMLGVATFLHAKDGGVTGGGPKNQAERQTLYRSGWQPYSIKVGDRYFAYGRLEPLGMVMGLASDANEIWDYMSRDEQESLAPLIVGSITQNILNKTFMKGLSDFFNASSDPARYGERWVQGFSGTVVPSVVGSAAQANDPIIRRAEGIIDKVKSRLPYASEGLLPKRDLFGREVERGEGGFVERFASPIYRSSTSDDKIDTEMVRLQLFMGMPTKQIKGVSLEPEEYDEYTKRSGQRAKRRLDEFVGSKFYDRLNDEVRQDKIRRIILQERRNVAKQVFRKIPRERQRSADK